VKPAAIMAASSVGSWAVAAVIVDVRTSIEFFFGMLGPLAAVIATWVLAEWIYRERPAEMTSLMLVAFLLKAVFFAGYVVVMLCVAKFRPVPFVGSFTGYFVGLYLIEALYLKRLFSERSR
jgi:hypothetical protein